MGKLGSKYQNCVVKLKFGTETNFEYPEFYGAVHFFCFRLETLFLGKFGAKGQNCQFELKFGT